MNQWITGYLVSHNTRLHFYRTGGTKNSIVLIHGITDDGLCWTPFAEVLAINYDAIMVDVRGHGKSDAPEKGYDYKTMAIEVAGLIEGLALENPIVIGHSMGAMIALTLAAFNPEMPRAIILEDPPAFWRVDPPTQEALDVQAGMRTRFYEVKRKTHNELLEAVRAENPKWSEAELGPWVDAKHRFSLKITQMLDSKDAIPVNFPELLKQITCPTLLLTADPKQGAILSDVEVEELQNLVSHLERVHIPDAGHNIRREQFSRYIDAVDVFLSKL